jgi:NAD(P)-dependent dehydrogenase (short-subunit alcohol dehydrogenase family)
MSHAQIADRTVLVAGAGGVIGRHVAQEYAARDGIGYTVGNPINLPMVIAVYASACRELGLPLM